MTITCIGKKDTDLTNAGAFNAITSASFSDTNFDETKVLSTLWTAAYGASYTAIEPEDVIEVEITPDIQQKNIANYGTVDLYLAGLSAVARFTPAGLDEEDIESILALQDSGAILPGQSLGKAGTDLVLTDGTRTVTLSNAGAQAAARAYGTITSRLGQLEFISTAEWSTGAMQALWSFTGF